MNTKISILTRVILALSAVCLVASLYVPIWQIDLDAPQYPEGLNLKIWADKLAGDVDIINGLNHYIGMKTLHAENFIEFHVLKYIILFWALFALLTTVLGRKKILYLLFFSFLAFGIIAMADFWRWEYNYGHDLDPHAAIIVPGMSYQPPLIGFKQLLNFGAFSIPDIGGWLYIASGALMLTAVLIESKILSRLRKKKVASGAISFLFVLFLCACSNPAPQPISINKDACDNCKMTISDPRFACELVTNKGRAYKFDDVACLIGFKNNNKDMTQKATYYVNEYLYPNALTAYDKLTFVEGDQVGSPMGGNTAAFLNKDSANFYGQRFMAKSVLMDALKQ
ncbi:MAG: nitrous oxide reductase accessory protein NosL [bacterium]|nr:nitrous oxide reductase accessory protein NosL [bacterium]